MVPKYTCWIAPTSSRSRARGLLLLKSIVVWSPACVESTSVTLAGTVTVKFWRSTRDATTNFPLSSAGIPVLVKVNLPPIPKSESPLVLTVSVVPESESSSTLSKITSRKTTARSPALGAYVPSARLWEFSRVNVVGDGIVCTRLPANPPAPKSGFVDARINSPMRYP